MGPRRDRLRRRLAALLALWVAVVGVGVSFSHSHAGGDTPHTHRTCRCLPAAPHAPAGHPDEPSGPHRHFVLFGVEFPGVEAPDAAPAGASASHVGPAAGTDCDPPPAHPHGDSGVPAPCGVAVDPAADPRPPAPAPVPSAPPSAFARRAVAGVLRS